ncbi:hypothetical protein [Rhizobium oryzicola]|uniref:Uncharacterized protein n=1 Tax=Rhizobium oryzicola TaxID=1232668 RepID=A0ABT8SRW0_9HYPH|nr:hypothetical protein [Rhizobium oryzicola]MDO1581155.1 hypothetical protein [Rhizobium oryzicola]
MIPEALNYTASWAVTPPAFRPAIASSIRLWSRANRCRKAWAAHEKNCHKHVLESHSTLRQRRTVVVLGSGLLRDVPIVELSQAFDTVVLVDLVHLASVRTWLAAKRLKNVRLISRDLSGLDEALAGAPVEPLSFLRQVPYLDLVISANILSQIGVEAPYRLKALNREPESNRILPQIIRAHLEGLSNLSCKACLLTDISYEVRDRAGQVQEQADLLAGVEPPPHGAEWDWPVVPFGEEGPNHTAIHRVIAG